MRRWCVGLVVAAGCLTALFTAPAALASTGWSAPVSVDPSFSPTSVSCPTSSFCVAVDAHGLVSADSDRNWSTPAQIDSNPLASVSCPTSSFCVAVDFSGNALTWNGTAWGSPAPIEEGDPLASVSCSATSFCMAVDESGDAFPYDGTSWGAAESTGGASVTSVACTSASFCVAVDESGDGLLYDGSAWSGSNIDPGAYESVQDTDSSPVVGGRGSSILKYLS